MPVPRRLAALSLAPVVLLTACSAASGEPSTDPTPVASVPASWLTSTAEGWPDSDGYGSSAPVLSNADCVLTDEVTVHGATGRTDMSGWGPYGDDTSATDAYRYVCEFRGDELSAQLQVIQAGSASDAAQTVDLFLDQPTNGDQENETTTVQLGDVDVHVNQRWYPKPEYGAATAMLLDAAANAVVVLEVTSLEADAFEEYTPEAVAADLMRALNQG